MGYDGRHGGISGDFAPVVDMTPPYRTYSGPSQAGCLRAVIPESAPYFDYSFKLDQRKPTPVTEMILAQNWYEELERPVPTENRPGSCITKSPVTWHIPRAFRHFRFTQAYYDN